MGGQIDLAGLRELVDETVVRRYEMVGHKDIPALCATLGMPVPPARSDPRTGEDYSKHERLAASLPATENHSISFHQYHLEDMGRVRTRKTCEIDGKQLSNAEIDKGFEVSRDTVVAVSDHELEEMPLPRTDALATGPRATGAPPTRASARCTYLADWTATKLRWNLAADTKEKTALAQLAADCPDTTVTYKSAP